MLPLLVVLSIYYLFMKFDCFGHATYNKIKKKTFADILFDGIFATWFGDVSWFNPQWTLQIEFVASYFVF